MDNSKLTTGLSLLSFAIIAVGLFMSIRIMIGYEDMVGSAITLSMVLIGVGAGVAVLFGIFQLLTNLKKNLSMLVGLAVFVVIAIVAYSMADDTILRTYPEGTTAGGVKFSEAGIFLMYFLVVLAAITAIVAEVSRLFK